MTPPVPDPAVPRAQCTQADTQPSWPGWEETAWACGHTAAYPAGEAPQTCPDPAHPEHPG